MSDSEQVVFLAVVAGLEMEVLSPSISLPQTPDPGTLPSHSPYQRAEAKDVGLEFAAQLEFARRQKPRLLCDVEQAVLEWGGLYRSTR